MPYDIQLADRVRLYLAEDARLRITEKTMFRGLAFLVNDKMCVNISGDNLMCRIDPGRHDEVSKRKGYMPMIMRGRAMNGYCYVRPEGFKSKKDFEYWMKLCLEFNPSAKASKKRKSSQDNGLPKVGSSKNVRSSKKSAESASKATNNSAPEKKSL